MSLSTSRQQFLAYETQGNDDIHYGRKGGIFISSCICAFFIILAIVVAVLVGVIVYFVTYFKISQSSQDIWDEVEPFALNNKPSPDLRLPPYVVPSFYRLKIKTDIEKSTFSGEVYITIRASKRVKEIILHSKNLTINNNVKLTEQIYEQETVYTSSRKRRQVNNTDATATENVTQPLNATQESFTPEISSEPTFEKVTANVQTDSVAKIDTQVTHSIVNNIEILSIAEGSGDRLILTLGTALKTGIDYILELRFTGNISNSLTGFYKSSYADSNNVVKFLAATQFEPTSARAAFPCFDEPAFKSKFEISIAHLQNLTALSNMKVAAQEPIPEEPGWQWTHFDRSVNMSTYLVAYVISDFKYLETNYTSSDNVTKIIRLWTRPDFLHKGKYALNITEKLLGFYEHVFGVPYALDKLDLIAIPDFSSGAMENWGLITFRETTLLFDESENAPRDKQSVAIDVAHELAHQWFGNLVTMKWWTDLWLNEGFATYIEYVGVDHIEPAWDMFESFTLDKMNLLRTDALKNTSPVSRRVIDATEISQKFDEISYTKGANLIRMLNHTISEELFHKGLTIYLNKWKFSNAEENDLWEAMSEANGGDPPVAELMNSWTRQPGYPVLMAQRDYDKGLVTFTQRPFSSGAEPPPGSLGRLWRVPLSWAAAEGPRRDTRPRLWLHAREASAPSGLDASQALYVNVDAVGYYRVNYDRRNWELLARALGAGAVASATARAQLLDDAFNLAKAGRLRYELALGLTRCAAGGEDSRLVWDILLANAAFLKHNLRATPGYVHFQDYMKKLLSKQLQKLNYGLDPPKDDNEAFLIENLVMWECLVEAPRCLKWAKNMFSQWSQQKDLTNNPIPSYLRPLVYTMAVQHGGREEFDFFWRLFLNSTDPAIKSLAISVLPSTRDEALVSLLLERSLGELPKQYAVAAWSVTPSSGTRLAQRFLNDQFPRVKAAFAGLDAFALPSVLAGAYGFVTDPRELEELKKFVREHKEDLMPMSQTIQKLIETATLRINWIEKHAKDINQWFKENVDGNTTEESNVSNSTESLLTQNITFNIPASTQSENSTTTLKWTNQLPLLLVYDC